METPYEHFRWYGNQSMYFIKTNHVVPRAWINIIKLKLISVLTTRHNYPGAVDPHLRVHRVRHTADLRHHPRQRPDDHPGQSSDERMMPCCTRDTDIWQGLILNDEGELEEEDDRNDLKKPKSAWSDSNHFNNFSKVF